MKILLIMAIINVYTDYMYCKLCTLEMVFYCENLYACNNIIS